MSQVLIAIMSMMFIKHQDQLLVRAQAATATSQRAASPDHRADAEAGSIVVEGYRERRSLPTLIDTPNNISAVKVRTKYEMSERIAACASRGKLTGLGRLRAVVDGEFNSASHAVAQDRLKRIYISCSEGISLLSFTTATESSAGVGLAATALTTNVTSSSQLSGTVIPNSVDAAPLGHSVYDRGAFMIRAMQAFAPDLTLTRAETNDAAVQERFNLREIPRNRYRDPVDYHYFMVAVCIVRVQPTLAVRLALSDKPAKLDGLQATLINRARTCVGDSARVQVDATQFRIYIADAVYRWVTAARNVASLIPIN